MLLIDHLDFQRLQAKQMVIHTLTSAPGTPVEGQLYVNTTSHILFFHNGTTFVPLVKGPSSSTDNYIPQWDGTSGALLKAGLGVVTTVGDPGVDTNIPTEQAVREAIVAGSGTNHAMLSSTHTDSVANAVTRGSLIYANSTPAWDELVVGTNALLYANGTDVAWASTITLATGGGLRTGTTAGNTIIFSGYDVGITTYQAMITITAHGTQPTMVINVGTINANDGTSGLTIADTTGLVTVPNNLTVTGDLTVNGTTTTVNTATLSVEDPLLELANGNAGDTVDIGMYWTYNDGTQKYGGIFRDVSDANRPIVFYEESTTDPGTGTAITWSTYADVAFGVVRAGTWNATQIGVIYGGTGLTSFAQYDMIYASAANTLSALAKVNNAVLISGSGGLPAWEAMATNGYLLIGGTSGPNAATLTQGTGISITNADQSITIAIASTVTRKVSANLGDGDASYTWNHALGLSVDTDIIVQVWGVTVNTDIQVFPTITVVDGNNIRFDFGFNVTSGDFKAVLIY